MFLQKLIRDFDGRKQLLRGQIFQAPRFLMLTCLLEIDTVGRTVERELALLTAALRADTAVDRRAEALFLANVADCAAQTKHLCGRGPGPKLPLWHLPLTGDSPKPHEQRLFERNLWKNPHKIRRKCFPQ